MIGDRGVVSEIALAISDEGRLAVVKRSEDRVELYGGVDSRDTRPVNNEKTKSYKTTQRFFCPDETPANHGYR